MLEDLYFPEGLSQTVNLSPGHYLLRALAKTNAFQVHVFAQSTRLPVAVSDDYQWVGASLLRTGSGRGFR